MTRLSLGIGSLLLSHVGFAETRWIITNASQEKIIMQCVSEKDETRSFSMATPALAIGAKSTDQYNWGDRYYNDGLGLNPGAWQCSVGKTGKSLQPAGSFRSAWGEEIRLTVNQSSQKFIVTKSDNDSRLSRSATHAPHP
jgi:hypothetical protein